MIFRVSAIARARGQALDAARRYASGKQVAARSAGGGGAMNAFARGWYNLYVELDVAKDLSPFG
jgi:hypothetical protein